MSAISLFFAASLGGVGADEVTLALARPARALEPVDVRLFLPDCVTADRISMEGGVSVVRTRSANCPSPPRPGTFPQDIELGRLPAGQYRVRLESRSPGNDQVERALTFTVAPPPAPLPGTDHSPGLLDLSGLWWDPAFNGESFVVEHVQKDDSLLISWNTYVDALDSNWFFARCPTQSMPGFKLEYHCAVYSPRRELGAVRVGI